jgi:hypothetical protein
MSGLEVEVLPIFFAAREAAYGPGCVIHCRHSLSRRVENFGSTTLRAA